MDFPNMWEWAPPETNTLPNNERLRLQFKRWRAVRHRQAPGIPAPGGLAPIFLRDAYMEMKFNTEDCSGDDAYGMIFRGPSHLAGVSYGYVVSFNLRRAVSPCPAWMTPRAWDIEVLENDDEIAAINTGTGAQNTIGVRAEGDKFVVYANGVQ